MSDLKRKIDEAAAFIKSKCGLVPRFAVVLGTGLDGFASQVDIREKISYEDIPNFPRTTLDHHSGNLILGTVGGVEVVVMEGRPHAYEGYSMEDITMPIRAMRALGAEKMIIVSAAGGLNPLHKVGDAMIIDDHINLMGLCPLVGPNDDDLGIRFPDMCEPYSRKMMELAEKIALEEGVRTPRGVYVGVTGPNLETRAEYRFLRIIGADAVGMSTVPEVIVGVHGGMEILAFAVLTDSCLPDALKPADIEAIISVAKKTEPQLTKIVCRVIKEYRQ